MQRQPEADGGDGQPQRIWRSFATALRSRRIRNRVDSVSPTQNVELLELCNDLLGDGPVGARTVAAEILGTFEQSDDAERLGFFSMLLEHFGADRDALEVAVADWSAAPSDQAVSRLHAAAEPRRQELIRRLNAADGGTLAILRMREHLRSQLAQHPELRPVDADFAHLLASWLGRGFLVLRRIDWTTPAALLEKLIEYEAVHEIDSMASLRLRVEPSDRRCYAFFHPALPGEPLVFVEVALTREIPTRIDEILQRERVPLEPAEASCAVFYSISNCQRGAAGISLGSSLIKQVVADLAAEVPSLRTFVTLSPIPGFVRWLERQNHDSFSSDAVACRRLLETPGWAPDERMPDDQRASVVAAADHYLRSATDSRDRPLDSVARFHLANGARIGSIHWLADRSEHGMEQSLGLMVNYLYEDGGHIDDLEHRKRS